MISPRRKLETILEFEKLINDELQSANKKFPLFSYWHEAYKAAMSLGREEAE